MCDTMVIVRPDRVLFAKNSDRDANEGQNLEWHSRRANASDSTVRCTYIEIPEARDTSAILISRPFWIWGAEIGANEHGVVIGNEAVFTNQPYEKEAGLIGMDLVRLGLERATTAREACRVITDLLDQYGQGGGCGHESRRFVYHNSFIAADTATAYVLETAGRRWALEEVHGARSISNGLTIPGFAKQYSDFVKTRANGCRIRQPRTQALCQGSTGVADLMDVLRDHGDGSDQPRYALTNGGLHAPCVHAGGILANSQTTASWVSELRPTQVRHWATATAAPCISLFKPVYVNGAVDVGPGAEDTFNESPWWRHEVLHRTVMRNPEKLRPLFEAQLREVQQRWLQSPPSSGAAFDESSRLLSEWTRDVCAQWAASGRVDTRPGWVRQYWRKRDRRAGLTAAFAESRVRATAATMPE